VSDNLHVKVTGSGDKRLILLHGLFGSAKNLGQLARAFKEGYTVYSVDLPDHGRSTWLPAASVAAYAEIVGQWLIHEGIGQVRVIGHSLGGKVAMKLALEYPTLIEKLVVLDIAPIAYSSRHDAVFAGLNAVVKAGVQTRAEAKQILEPLLEEPRVADFLLTSAEITDRGVIDWRFNLAGIQAGYDKILGGIAEDFGGAPVYERDMLVIRGELSDYVVDDSGTQFRPWFPSVNVTTVRGTGHWLHQEKSSEVYEVACQFFDRID
jgi:esterase